MPLTFAYAEKARPDYALFEDVSWQFYESILTEIGDGTTRVTYDRGRMEVMSPLGEHERYKKRFDLLLDVLMLDFDIPFVSYGSATFKEIDLQRGLEPDECYYIANEAKVREVVRFDLNIHPPPDLVLEMDITHRAIDRESIYAAMGVPEIWKFDGEKLVCLVLSDKQKYVESEMSRSFPFLRPSDLVQFIEMVPAVSHNEMARSFREWLKTLQR